MDIGGSQRMVHFRILNRFVRAVSFRFEKSNNAAGSLWKEALLLKAVIKLGGFAFSESDGQPLVEKYVELFKGLVDKHHLVVVAGGGRIARYYIQAAREMDVSESLCDHLGILASRLNARLLVDGLGEHAFPQVPTSVDELKHYFASGKIVGMGGLTPGHSTNAVAAIAAETVKADLFVNATDVDGVYTSDPSRDTKATKLDEVTVDRLSEILSKTEITAGTYDLMDPLALRIIQRSQIPTIILNGRVPDNVLKALQNERVGTRIVHH
jgi:uridylate kinase